MEQVSVFLKPLLTRTNAETLTTVDRAPTPPRQILASTHNIIALWGSKLSREREPANTVASRRGTPPPTNLDELFQQARPRHRFSPQSNRCIFQAQFQPRSARRNTAPRYPAFKRKPKPTPRSRYMVDRSRARPRRRPRRDASRGRNAIVSSAGQASMSIPLDTGGN